jgi:hypothetical protein
LSNQGSALASIREGSFDSLVVSLNWTEIKQLPDVKASVKLSIRLENCGNGVSVQLEPPSPEFDDVLLGKNGELIPVEILNKLHSIMLKSITAQVKSIIK